MKEIKAFIHRSRVADVVRALEKAGYRGLSVIAVNGMLKALDHKEQEYIGRDRREVIAEVKLELVCEDDKRTAEAAWIIQETADTGHPEAGWIYVSEILKAMPIGKRRDA
jgi:nitrogen regulatory protein P-II 1